VGVPSNAVREVKMPVLGWTAAEAANLLFWFSYIRFFGTLTIESNGVSQGKSPSFSQSDSPCAES
jgi:hypothetical protein